jgi:hypothetical protein
MSARYSSASSLRASVFDVAKELGLVDTKMSKWLYDDNTVLEEVLENDSDEGVCRASLNTEPCLMTLLIYCSTSWRTFAGPVLRKEQRRLPCRIQYTYPTKSTTCVSFRNLLRLHQH